MVVKSAIIPAAGLGTRMLPWTKEVPKEMLPVAVQNGESFEFKPVLHFIFDALFNVGVRYFYFIVGRGKRIIEDYFTPDWSFIDLLEQSNKIQLASNLHQFYDSLDACDILMVNQPAPRGFGDAVLRVAPFMATEIFFIHAGDDILYPNHEKNLVRMVDHFEKHQPDGICLYEQVDNPSMYGVIVGQDVGEYVHVDRVIEKPRNSPSNKSIVAVYVFTKDIFSALRYTKPSKGELQLTDAIETSLRNDRSIHALEIQGSRADFGLPKNYLQTLRLFSHLI